jgi:hypothetical protein
MNVGKLLKRLNQEEEIKDFYSQTSDIKAIMASGRNWPKSEDIEGWKILFEDAYSHALERLAETEPSETSTEDDIEAQYPEIFGE